VAAVRSDAEIEAVASSLGQKAAGGLVSMADNFMLIRRALIISLAAQTTFRRFIMMLTSLETVVCFPTAPTRLTRFIVRRPTSIAFYVAQSRRSFPSNCRPNL
jgi:hypothetical protein